MAAVNQPIPNFTGGVSQQPDSRKFPGQLRVCDNVVPDIVHGLIKRPPGEFLSKLANANDTGFWYEIIRDGDEKFLMQITPANYASNPIRVWNLTPITVATNFYDDVPKPGGGDYSNGEVIPIGTEMDVDEDNDGYDYLNGCTSEPGVLSLQDYTLITNPQKVIASAGNPDVVTLKYTDSGGSTSDVTYGNGAKYAWAELDILSYNTEYVIYNDVTPPPAKKYWRVTGLTVEWYDDLGGTNWVRGADNDSHLAGPSFTENHGHNPPDGDHGKYNGQVLWSANGRGEDIYLSCGQNADIKHYASTRSEAKTINGIKVDCFHLSSIGNNGSGVKNHWTVGDMVKIDFNKRVDGSNPTATLTGYTEDGEFEIIHRDNNSSFWCKAPVGPGSAGGNDGEDFGFGVISCGINDVQGGVTVNSVNFQDSDERLFEADDNDEMDTSGDAGQFLGFGYDTKYTAEVTIRSGGIIKCQNEDDALRYFVDVKIETKYYRIKVNGVEEVETFEGGACSGSYGFYRTPSAQENGPLSVSAVLSGLRDSVNQHMSKGSALARSQIVGTGLFIDLENAADDKSVISFLGGQADQGMTVLGRSARNISKLPAQSVHGYVVEINNSENTESDNYYMEFIADNSISGTGKWEECMRPNKFKDSNDTIKKGWDEDTMPHALVNNRTGKFTFTPFKEGDTDPNYWAIRDSGDDETNPYPSIKGQKIQRLFFHRNRLGFISNENVVLSRPSDYFNLWNVSSITYTEDNPIDITVNDTKPAYIRHTLPYQGGVLMFSDNGQFLLYSDAELFSAKTIRLKKLASYESAADIAPIDLGTSTMFTSNVSSYTRAFEARVTGTDSPPFVHEHTNFVPEYIPKDITLLKNSPVLGIATFGKKNSSEIYHFKHVEEGSERVQTAFYSWTLQGTLQYCFYNAGMFYTVTKHGSDFILNKYEYVTDIDVNSYTVDGDAADVGSRLKIARGFEGHLDCMVVKSGSDIVVSGGNSTVKNIGYTPTGANGLPSPADFYFVGLTGDDAAGTVKKATAVSSADNGSAVFDGIDLTGWTVAVGYKYTGIVELPNYYMSLGSGGTYDTNADLKISALNFDLGVSGPMEFHLTSTDEYVDDAGNITKAFDDYIQVESGLIANRSKFSKVPSALQETVRVPIYKKNKNYNLTIKLPDPFYTAIVSGSWDGIYNQRRHVRR